MARVRIDLDRVAGHVDRRIFGGFIEHLGRCIYGGIFDEGSPLSDARGFRTDVMQAVEGLNIPILRWPGGNFVSGYDWTDGIGPQDQRPRRPELAWHSVESNRFGTDEFIEYCRAIGAQPYICVNMGTGTMDQARAWVEYCNGTGDTYWANQRRANGHDEPYNVRYWGLGNEMYGAWQIGALAAEDYVKKAIEFAKVMIWTDPSIELVGCGLSGWSEWDWTVLNGLAKHVRYHSIHIYTGSEDHYETVFSPHKAERAIRLCAAMIERVRYDQGIEHDLTIAYDEWNVWFRQRAAASRLEERYTLTDALTIAGYLNAFIRQCEALGMANQAQLVNVIAPIFTSPDGLFKQTIYYPFALLAAAIQPVALNTWVDSPTHVLSGDTIRPGDEGPYDLLDVSATRDEARERLTLSLVNRSAIDDLETTIDVLQGIPAQQIELNDVTGPDVSATYDITHPDTVTIHTRTLTHNGGPLTLTIPAHTHQVLQLRLSED
jgi:alpha-N-arabinofuranosidase